MAYAFEILKRLNSVNITEELSAIAGRNTLMIADAQREQLLEGRSRTGEYLPRYDQDPYFKTIAQAKGYEAYKAKKSQSKTKPSGVMDFYINGYTHRSIQASVSGDSLKLDTGVDWNSHLEEVQALGINPQTVRDLWKFAFQPLLCEAISKKTGIPYTLPSYAMK